MSATAFYSAGPLIHLAGEVLDVNRRQPNILNGPLTEKDRLTLLKELRALRVRTVHLERQRQYRIDNISRRPANEETFDWNGNNVTVANYFAEKYNIHLKYPNLPCVQVGTKCTLLPMECCHIIPGQHCRKKLSELQTASMIKKTAVPPKDRFQRLVEAARNLEKTSADFCNEFEMRIDPVPLKVEARVLDPPIIRFGNDKNVKPISGVWRLDGKFLRPTCIKVWAIAILGELTREQITTVIQLFKKEGGKLGMQIPQPVHIQSYGMQSTATKILAEIKNKVPNVQITLVVLGRFTNYAHLKAAAETSDLCMRTQCVKDSNVSNERKFNGMFVQNLLQKINTKLGGVNNGIAVSRPKLMMKPFMVVGIDVYHAAPGELIYLTIISICLLILKLTLIKSTIFCTNSVQVK